MEPSRADAVDDWGTTRKFVPGGGDGGSRGFGGGFGDRDRAPREPREFKPSAADAVDDWGAQRKFEPSGARGFGDDRRGGFGDRERRFDGPPPPSKADMEDSWGRGREFKPAADAPSRPSRGFAGDNASAADKEERWGRKAPEPSAAAAESSGPSERPRLKLAPRSVPADGAGAGSSDAAGAGSKSNPFGAARPCEEVLKEKGVDPIKEALKLEHGEVIRCAVGLTLGSRGRIGSCGTGTVAAKPCADPGTVQLRLLPSCHSRADGTVCVCSDGAKGAGWRFGHSC